MIYAELRHLNEKIDSGLGRLNERIDRVNEHIDTVIDSLAELRRDVDRHTHES